MTNAKICGLSTPETLAAAIAGGASHVGFVFFPPSPRNVTPDQAAALAAQVPGHVAKVGVFVDPDDALLDAAIAAARLDGIQLHKAAPQRTAEIRARTRRERSEEHTSELQSLMRIPYAVICLKKKK